MRFLFSRNYTVEIGAKDSDAEEDASDDNGSYSTSDSDEVESNSSADETTITENPESHDMSLYFRIENGKGSDISTSASAACTKLNKYYPSSDGLVYIMGLREFFRVVFWFEKFYLDKLNLDN
ncbi:unnamed protein product [Allacma fusca]|uniref:Uncharacterized protein n=1 Tax=Allacma fusca TaxID=39272 RepID=A0A8J2LKV2_9HEXA|nr:unnamed protein product [Allacma fusca]